MSYRLEAANGANGTTFSRLGMITGDLQTPDTAPSSNVRPRPRVGATIIIIDTRALDRECLAKGLMANDADTTVFSFATIEEWQQATEVHAQASAILLSLGSRDCGDANVEVDVTGLAEDFKGIPIIAIGDLDTLAHIMKILEYGARGYIPTSVGLDVAIEAIRLARAGGIFVPASSLMSVHRRMTAETASPTPALNTMFTARQAAVVDALRRGKANKIIAYELNLCESTVKVHIRNIMKKLKAKNRTEVAFKINDLFPRGVPIDPSETD
jgi:DNA-binding NarL/FixJ family response regulator